MLSVWYSFSKHRRPIRVDVRRYVLYPFWFPQRTAVGPAPALRPGHLEGQVNAFLSETRRLTEREMMELFPDPGILSERFPEFKKSLIAAKTGAATQHENHSGI